MKNSLSEALLTMPTQASQAKYEYRVFYDKTTKECIRKDVVSPGIQSNDCYVTLSESEYNDVEFCSKFYVTKDMKIKRKKVDFTESLKLQLTDNATNCATLKDNNIFITDKSTNVDFWTLRENE